MKVAEHKGYSVEFDEYREEFQALVGDSMVFDKSFSGLKRKIDDVERKGFRRTCVLVRTFGGVWGSAQVTSEVEGNRTYGEKIYLWIVKHNGKREKVSVDSVMLDTPENREIMRQIEVLQTQREDLRKQVFALEKKMSRYKPTLKVPE